MQDDAAPEANSKAADRLTPCEVLHWSQEQFKDLGEQRRAFEQHMWQFPVATLGVIALLLNATKALDVTNPANPRLSAMVLLLSFFMCLYGMFFLCRLRARRKLREERMKAIEARIGVLSTLLADGTSVVTSERDVTARARNSNRKEIRWFGQVGTTRLGVAALAITATALLLAILCLPWRTDKARGATPQAKTAAEVTARP